MGGPPRVRRHRWGWGHGRRGRVGPRGGGLLRPRTRGSLPAQEGKQKGKGRRNSNEEEGLKDLIAAIAKASADRDARRAAEDALKAEERRRSQEMWDSSVKRELDHNARMVEMRTNTIMVFKHFMEK